MAYEVWMFEDSGDGKPSQLVAVKEPPAAYSLGEVIAWARKWAATANALNTNEMRAYVRQARSY